MLIYPAIDLRQQQCVRLLQGDYAQQTVYSSDPFAVAQSYQQQGASYLHVVDLDGAQAVEHNQHGLICDVIKAVKKLQVQVGGGIRSAEHIEMLLQAGAQRVIVGSLAVTQMEQVSDWLKQFGGKRISLAFDVKLQDAVAYVTTAAWQKISDVTLNDLLDYYQAQPLQHILVTDIQQDGTLQGPNIALYRTIKKQFPQLLLQASGGVGCLKDLTVLKAAQIDAAIVGKALYENRFSLQEALAC
jgi:phosphoribosylformimino-5-aminoimidazole carboxamide ribotide isomerase